MVENIHSISTPFTKRQASSVWTRNKTSFQVRRFLFACGFSRTMPMKSHSILFAALVGGFALAHAEDAATPATAAPTSPTEAGTLQPLQTQDLLLAPTLKEVMPAPAAAATATAATPPVPWKKGTAEQLREAIRIRELKTVVEEDPAVVAQKATAQCAKTEEGRCVAMRNYYTLLYTKIEKLDPSLQPVLEGQLHDILLRYEQHKVYPSVLIEPIAALPGSDSADHGTEAEKAASSSETPKKKEHKHKRQL